MNIVILSTQRSGSTLVCDDLMGTKKLGKPTEHFINLLDNKKLTLNEIRTYLKEKSETENGVQSLKIMANQLEPVDALLKKAGGKPYKKFFLYSNNLPYKYLYNEYKNAKFLRIIRNDKVAQAVSIAFASRTNIYHLVENKDTLKDIAKKDTIDDTIKNVEFEYDGSEIEKRIGFIIKQEQIIDEFLSIYNIKPILIYYEEIIEQQNYIIELANKLGIKDVSPSKRTLKKITGKNAQYWIDRYKKEQAVNQKQ